GCPAGRTHAGAPYVVGPDAEAAGWRPETAAAVGTDRHGPLLCRVQVVGADRRAPGWLRTTVRRLRTLVPHGAAQPGSGGVTAASTNPTSPQWRSRPLPGACR